MKRFAILCAVLIPVFISLAQTKQPLTFDAFIGIGRVTDPQVSPDGKTVAFVVTYHIKVENKANSNIYLVPVEEEQLNNSRMRRGRTTLLAGYRMESLWHSSRVVTANRRSG